MKRKKKEGKRINKTEMGRTTNKSFMGKGKNKDEHYDDYERKGHLYKVLSFHFKERRRKRTTKKRWDGVFVVSSSAG